MKRSLRTALQLALLPLLLLLAACSEPADALQLEGHSLVGIEVSQTRIEDEEASAEPVIEHEEPADVVAPEPPERVDPEQYGYSSYGELEGALRDALGVPEAFELHIFEEEQDGKRGLSISGVSNEEAR